MEFFNTHVLINFQRYLDSEDSLSNAAKSFSADSDEYRAAIEQVMVDAMNAAIAIYHLADHIFLQNSNAFPSVVYQTTKLDGYREFLDKNRCIYIGNGRIVNDLSLLGSIVDAYKHFDLNNKSRPVTSANATIVVSTGWGELPFGEFKWGGLPQVIVKLNGGQKRALKKILQNVIEMWKLEIQIHSL